MIEDLERENTELEAELGQLDDYVDINGDIITTLCAVGEGENCHCALRPGELGMRRVIYSIRHNETGA